MHMSIILAIETSSELASAALSNGASLIARESSGVQTHSQTLLPMVQALLAEAGMALADCDAIAFGSGPGSFTGVRTACGVAQGLAYGLDLPVVPIVTLEAMAEACREQTGSMDVVAVLDARMDEVYWAHYQYHDGWTVIVEPTLSVASDVRFIEGAAYCGNGLLAYASMFDPAIVPCDAQEIIMPHAKYIARQAQHAFANGVKTAARDAQPLYVRNKVALTTAERMAKAAHSVPKAAA